MGEQTDNRHAGIDLADSHDTPIHNKIADKKTFENKHAAGYQ